VASFPIGLLGSGTLAAARSLLGALLVDETDPGPRSGRIVEVEAYVGRDDLASHAHRGPSLRNAVMFGPFGVAYVYLVYGMYECLNVVTEPDGVPAAVLVRAVEPVVGVDLMRAARLERVEARAGRWSREKLERERARIRALPDVRIAAGPGLVCAALSITRADNGSALCDAASPLRLELPASRETHAAISSGPRIGIGYAPEPWRSHPWRFWLTGNPAVSR
jgi:DNA-3-methyladenine glycosylase